LSVTRNRPDMFIYLHGFNSSGESAKGKFFANYLTPHIVLTPSYPPDPDTALVYLIDYLNEHLADNQAHDPLILIGSSLGGFYAQYLAHQFKLASVLINPALQPTSTLRASLGWQTNFYTGERYYFGEQQLARLLRYDVKAPCKNQLPRLVLLESGDEIIDYRYALQRYADCAQVIVYPNGNHQFQHLAEAAETIKIFANAKL
jgi:predicted esterase YcpF (UPF0227 family)